MTWTVIAVLAIGTYALKAAGPVLLGERQLPPRVRSLARLLPVAMLCALVLLQTVQVAGGLALDARAAGLAAATAAILARAPFIVVVAVAMIVAAGLRALGWAS